MTIDVSDGERLYAVRYASGPEANSLFVTADASGVRALYPATCGSRILRRGPRRRVGAPRRPARPLARGAARYGARRPARGGRGGALRAAPAQLNLTARAARALTAHDEKRPRNRRKPWIGLETARLLPRRDGYTLIWRARGGGRRAGGATRCATKISTPDVIRDVTSPASVAAAADTWVNDTGASTTGQQRRHPARGDRGRRERPVDADMFRGRSTPTCSAGLRSRSYFLPLLRRARRSHRQGHEHDDVAGGPEQPGFAVLRRRRVGLPGSSKAALKEFTVGLSKMLAETDVKVNAVCPACSRPAWGARQPRAGADDGGRWAPRSWTRGLLARRLADGIVRRPRRAGRLVI